MNWSGLKKSILAFLLVAVMAVLAAVACEGIERVPPDELRPPPMPEQQRRETPTPVGGVATTTAP